jgi:glycosyltransferase involved in cell wall biosynthesis
MSETGVDNIGAVPKQPPSAGEPLRLLFVGRLFRTKGVLDAIRAIPLVAPQHRIEFNVVGGGPILDACKEEARRLGVSDIVHFHGRIPRDEVTRWYERSHVFLFPSYREASGNVVFEAMNHGLPVIACNAGGPGYVVTDRCGVCVEPTNPSQYPAALARAIDQIASDTADYSRLSAAALARIEEVASWPRNVARLSALYADVATNANGHRLGAQG